MYASLDDKACELLDSTVFMVETLYNMAYETPNKAKAFRRSQSPWIVSLIVWQQTTSKYTTVSLIMWK